MNKASGLMNAGSLPTTFKDWLSQKHIGITDKIFLPVQVNGVVLNLSDVVYFKGIT
jgi:hypothetical protein